LWGADT